MKQKCNKDRNATWIRAKDGKLFVVDTNNDKYTHLHNGKRVYRITCIRQLFFF